MRPVSLTLQTLCPGYETVFLYWMLFSHSLGCGLFIRIPMGQYRIAWDVSDGMRYSLDGMGGLWYHLARLGA